MAGYAFLDPSFNIKGPPISISTFNYFDHLY